MCFVFQWFFFDVFVPKNHSFCCCTLCKPPNIKTEVTGAWFAGTDAVVKPFWTESRWQIFWCQNLFESLPETPIDERNLKQMNLSDMFRKFQCSRIKIASSLDYYSHSWSHLAIHGSGKSLAPQNCRQSLHCTILHTSCPRFVVL